MFVFDCAALSYASSVGLRAMLSLRYVYCIESQSLPGQRYTGFTEDLIFGLEKSPDAM